MRRVSIEKAKPGMEVGRALLDKYGNMLLPAGVALKQEHLDFINGRDVWEILIEDGRVPDLTIKPLIRVETQKEAIEAIHRLLSINRSGVQTRDMNDPDMFAARLEVERLSYAIVQSILQSPLGEPDLTGCMSPTDLHWVLPVQVTALAILLAREAGFDSNELSVVGRAAMLQNIGYIWISPQIWQEENSLSAEGRQEFEKHPIYGYEALSQLDRIPAGVVEAVLQHHERWDGTGYPNRTKGWDISPTAQIIGMAEAYYELVSATPQRGPYRPMDAFEYVMASGGELFDPELVQIFSRRVPVYPSGVMVQLSTKEMGIITNVNLGHVGRPTVRICYDVQGNEIYPPFDMDLSIAEHQFKLITQIVDI